jgi:hypothetical protein
MHRRSIGTFGILSLALAGCSNGGILTAGDQQPVSLLPVSDVVNAVKCELAETFTKRPDLRDLVLDDPNKADVKGSLELKNAIVDSVTGNAGVTVPILGIELGPSGSLARSATAGQVFNVEFAYDLGTNDGIPAFCSALATDVQVKGDPFIYMLDAIRSQHAKLGAGAPKVKLGSIAYTSAFSVDVERVGGVTLKILVFSLGAKSGRKATDSQSLKLTFGLNLVSVIIVQ